MHLRRLRTGQSSKRRTKRHLRRSPKERVRTWLICSAPEVWVSKEGEGGLIRLRFGKSHASSSESEHLFHHPLGHDHNHKI